MDKIAIIKWSLYQVGDDMPEFIVSQTPEEALGDHLARIGADWYEQGEVIPVEVVSLERVVICQGCRGTGVNSVECCWLLHVSKRDCDKGRRRFAT
ncbi:hypothetical protein [Paenibacillus agricola]|uniref:Uncharacterized protein n=1 Tax=Paenibacillus agricola TaxID=2716264 RepID=A0ABX0J780_9BACL|nr:hypothetical protein [Paenibacillus agricola]NHN31216.1 hypothetical protein [Paenibacillus agricola]